jgi:hypothetical protein
MRLSSLLGSEFLSVSRTCFPDLNHDDSWIPYRASRDDNTYSLSLFHEEKNSDPYNEDLLHARGKQFDSISPVINFTEFDVDAVKCIQRVSEAARLEICPDAL